MTTLDANLAREKAFRKLKLELMAVKTTLELLEELGVRELGWLRHKVETVLVDLSRNK